MLSAVAASVRASSTAGWWWFGGLGVLLWLACLVFLGLPVAWLVGAFMPSRR
jgi:hypothetical protein